MTRDTQHDAFDFKEYLEVYTPDRRAAFLLSNYRAAVAEVKKLGLDPARIPHHKPRTART
jgi:hypothetical protein